MKKRMIALLLATSMILGQTVYAEELAGEGETAEIQENTEESYDTVPESYVGNWVYNWDTGSYEEVGEMSVYTDNPMIERTGIEELGNIKNISVEVEDESVCTVTADYYEIDNYTPEGESVKSVFLTVNGLKEGTTKVKVKTDVETEYSYAGDWVYGNVVESSTEKTFNITVKPLPEDAAGIKDPALNFYLCGEGSADYFRYDKNGDGYISQKELKDVDQIQINGSQGIYSKAGLKTLEGLESAEGLEWVELDGNNQLKNVNALFGKTKLRHIGLKNTAVSDEDRWKLSGLDVQEIEGNKADFITIVKYSEVFDEDVVVTIIDPDNTVRLEYGTTLFGVEVGTAKVRVQYHNLSNEITVKVNGIQTDQELGEKSDTTITEIINTSYSNYILDSNHTLWETGTPFRKKAENVKKYVGDWVYCQEGYILDMQDILWKGEQKIAEEIQDMDERYALDKKGNLHNLYNQGDEIIKDVKVWKHLNEDNEEQLYVLKNDGTLWERAEVQEDQKANELEKVAESIKQLSDWAYLENDGTVHLLYGNYNVPDVKATELAEWEDKGDMHWAVKYLGIYDTEGKLWICDDNDSENIMKTDISERVLEITINEQYGYGNFFVLTETGKLYKSVLDYSSNRITSELFMDNIKEMCYAAAGKELQENPNPEVNITFRTKDDKYYDGEGKEVEEAVRIEQITSWWGNWICFRKDGTSYFQRAGVPILTGVIKSWFGGDGSILALRSDGTVWDVTDIPEKIADLNNGTEFAEIKGDVNRDNSVNETDARWILQSICKKKQLTNRQQILADMTDDGKVDIRDAREIVKSLNGKSELLN